MRRRGGEVLVDRRDGGLRHEDREGDAARPPPPGPRGGGVPQDGPGERDRLPERSVVRAHRLKITRGAAERSSGEYTADHARRTLDILPAHVEVRYRAQAPRPERHHQHARLRQLRDHGIRAIAFMQEIERSEEHTSELQSLAYLVCRLLLEKKKNKNK